jgi:hypothetical protein
VAGNVDFLASRRAFHVIAEVLAELVRAHPDLG